MCEAPAKAPRRLVPLLTYFHNRGLQYTQTHCRLPHRLVVPQYLARVRVQHHDRLVSWHRSSHRHVLQYPALQLLLRHRIFHLPLLLLLGMCEAPAETLRRLVPLLTYTQDAGLRYTQTHCRLPHRLVVPQCLARVRVQHHDRLVS